MNSSVCASSPLIRWHVGTPFSLCVRKGTYSLCTVFLWRIRETGKVEHLSSVFGGSGESLFSNLFPPHLKMVWLFPPEITLTLPMKTVRQREPNTLLEERLTLWFISQYGQIWKYFCGTDVTLNDFFFIIILSSPRTIKWAWQALCPHCKDECAGDIIQISWAVNCFWSQRLKEWTDSG